MHPAAPAALSSRAFRVRAGLIGALAGAAAVTLLAVPRFPQDPAFHNFADQRTLWGVPHALNVLSNLPFVIFGLLGLAWLLRPAVWRSAALEPWQRWAFLALFAGVAATGVGSAYYHANPTNATLTWDRLPLTVVLMTFFALVLADRVNPRLGPWLWPPLVVLGVVSVLHWHWTETAGAGDIRLYALVQFFPMAAIPLVLLLFPARAYPTAALFAVLGWYVLAKLLELLDGVVYTANGVVSGHTLKHLVASLGALWMVLLVQKRYAGAKDRGHAHA
jgi:hypothetical protein